MCECLLVWMCITCMQCLRSPEEGVGSCGTGVTAMRMLGALPRSSARAGSAPLRGLSSSYRPICKPGGANRLRVILHNDEKSCVSDPDSRRRSRWNCWKQRSRLLETMIGFCVEMIVNLWLRKKKLLLVLKGKSCLWSQCPYTSVLTNWLINN